MLPLPSSYESGSAGRMVPVHPVPRGDVRKLLAAAAAVTTARFSSAIRSRSVAIERVLDWISDAVSRAMAGERTLASPPPMDAPIHRILIHVRHELLVAAEAASETYDARDVVRLLLAVEGVQHEIGRMAPAERDLADELLGLHGRNLVVQIAHDMRSPLTSVLFLVNMLRSGQSGPLAPLQQRQLDLIYGSAFGLSALVNDVVELSQEADRMIEYEPLAFSIEELLHSVRDVLQPIAEEKQLEIRLEGPSCDARLGYPAPLTRVLLNLATNALKFTEEGYVAIRVRDAAPPPRVEVSVEDSGRGVPRDVLDALFPETLVRRRQSPTGSVSTGLGLGISRELVSVMGGTLRVERERSRGSRFYFELELPVAPEGR